ncbi:hypothetical protein CCHR01_09630 [Colletotrichum chrysophilum]|uniref:Uncharacterized protein n=1 Tax=Colletotrichum chrysophilum TaxID=1836956 RepID=A0AAD9EGJ3_9PEZI|nr:hypothetical protein CCHR01_09630 [Colletotrichum chrysophilum]
MRYVVNSPKSKVFTICILHSLKDCAVTRAKCMRQKIQVNGSLTASFRPSQVPPTVSSWPPLEHKILYCAISRSAGVRKRVFCGQSGRRKKADKPMTNVAIPSMRKNHCHEWRFLTPSIVVRIPAARKPEMMLEMVFPACQTAMRMGLSCLLYQDDVTTDVNFLQIPRP